MGGVAIGEPHHMLYRPFQIITAVIGLALAGCSTAPGGEGAVTSTAAASPEGMTLAPPIAAGTALPAGYKVDADRTIIFGTNEAWTGRLSYSTSASADDVFEFLHKEMPNFGWAEVSSMRANPSLFTFTSSSTGRMATITIARSVALGSTRVDMVVMTNGSAGAKN